MNLPQSKSILNLKYFLQIFFRTSFWISSAMSFKNYYHIQLQFTSNLKLSYYVLDYLKKYLEENWVKIISSFRVKEWIEIKNVKTLKEKFRVANEKFEIWNLFDNIKNVLIIDDMVNTGASMCAIANKLKKKNKNLKVDWLAIVGSQAEEMISDV